MNLRVLEVRIINKGSLLAEVVVKYGEFDEVRGFTAFRNGKGAWVAWPCRTWGGKDGQRHWDPIIKPSSELRKSVDIIILQAVADKFREEGIWDQEIPF